MYTSTVIMPKDISKLQNRYMELLAKYIIETYDSESIKIAIAEYKKEIQEAESKKDL